MPNIPVAYQKGVIGWIGNRNIDKNDEILLVKLLTTLGKVIKCNNEEKLDKLSMIAGCGTGYATYFMANLAKVAKIYGFKEKEAKEIVLSTFSGIINSLEETGLGFGFGI